MICDICKARIKQSAEFEASITEKKRKPRKGYGFMLFYLASKKLRKSLTSLVTEISAKHSNEI